MDPLKRLNLHVVHRNEILERTTAKPRRYRFKPGRGDPFQSAIASANAAFDANESGIPARRALTAWRRIADLEILAEYCLASVVHWGSLSRCRFQTNLES